MKGVPQEGITVRIIRTSIQKICIPIQLVFFNGKNIYWTSHKQKTHQPFSRPDGFYQYLDGAIAVIIQSLFQSSSYAGSARHNAYDPMQC